MLPYLHRYRFLHMIWQGFPEFFATLSFVQQRTVHDYYLLSKDLTDEQLLEHQRTVIAEDLQLPARAAKAFKQLEAVYRLTFAQAKGDPERWRAILNQHLHRTLGPPNKRGRRLSISVLARTEVDTM